MANLRQFIWKGSKAGMKLDFYAGRWTKLGTGEWITVEDLHLKVQGKGEIAGNKFEGTVEIVMPDNSPKGHCKVTLNGALHDKCPYETVGHRLKITLPQLDRLLELENNDKEWTWIGISGVPTWIGLWPQGAALATTGRFGPEE